MRLSTTNRKKNNNVGSTSRRTTSSSSSTVRVTSASTKNLYHNNNNRRQQKQKQKQNKKVFGGTTVTTTATLKMKIKAILLGFVLGLCTYNMISIIIQSDENLHYSNQIYDMALEATMPLLYLNHHHLSTTTKVQQSSACNSTTTTTTTLNFKSNIRKKIDEEEEDAQQKINPSLSTTTKLLSSSKTSTINISNIINNKYDIIPPNNNPTSSSTSSNSTTKTNFSFYKYVKDYDPNLPAVLVTKIHGYRNLPILQQSICLLTYAYNNRVNYDIIVFYSEPITLPQHLHEIEVMKQLVYPAKINFVIDNPGLYTMIQNELTIKQQQHLLQRCGNVPTIYNLTWYTNCLEVCSTYNITERIAYTWQAEFRSKWIWIHPAIQEYQYMLWFDSDAFCTQIWDDDPLGVVAKNDLAILFDHFPQGHSRGHELPYKIQQAFDNQIICRIDMNNNDGTLYAKSGNCLGKDSRIKLIHGFLHVTNLNFYKSKEVQKWTHTLIDNNKGTKFSRQYDDQIAVTVPAAILAGNKSWDMRKHSIELHIAHNGHMDGNKKITPKIGNFITWWKQNGLTKFPQAYQKCNIVAGQ